MARKQNKSVKVTKKDSSTRINTKKSGKVQKKLQDSKTKKKVESQVKQALKTQGKQNKNVAKVITSPVTTSKSFVQTKKSSTPSTQRAKRSTSTKASTSPQTNKVESASKRKGIPVKQPESKKPASTMSPQKSNKKGTSTVDQEKVGNKMSLRGKKRNYAQLASGNKTEENNVLKKKKTEEPKIIISRRSGSTNPTVKGSEGRNTVLQRKSPSTPQKKTSNKAGKPLQMPSVTAKKSPKQNKKSSPPKLAGSPKTKRKTIAKSPKRQSRGKVTTKEIKKPSPSKNTAKNHAVTDADASKSPKVRSRTRKSTANETDSPSKNALATTITNKFTSSVSNKRKSKNSDPQENVIVAQGILNDILYSVGNPDILINDKESAEKSNEKVSTSDLSMNIDQNEETKNVQRTDILSETKNSAVIESKEQSSMGDCESGDISGKVDSESTLESKSEPNETVNLETNDSIDFDKGMLSNNKDLGNTNTNVFNVTEDDIELHLTDASSTSLNENDLPSENISTVEAGTETRCEIKLNDGVTTAVSNYTNKCNDKQTTEENNISDSFKNEHLSHVNGNVSTDNSTGDSSLGNSPKVSPQICTKEEESLLPEKPLNTLETVLENSTGLASLAHKEAVDNKCEVIAKEEFLEPSILINQEEPESSDIKINLKSTESISKKDTTGNDMHLNPNGKMDRVENGIAHEIKSNSESNVVEHQTSSINGTSTISDPKVMTSNKGDSSTISCLSPSIDKLQTGQSCQINIDQKELKKDEFMTNGDESISPDLSLQKNCNSVLSCPVLTEELTSPGNKKVLETSKDEREFELNNMVVGNVNTDIHQSIPGEQKDELKFKDDLTLHSSLTSENTKGCLKNEKISTEETRYLSNDETKGSKGQGLFVEEQKESEKLLLDTDVSPNHVEEKKEFCDAQNVQSDCLTVSDESEAPNSSDKNFESQKIEHETITLNQKMTSNLDVGPSDCAKITGEEIINSEGKIPNGTNSSLEHIATEVSKEISFEETKDAAPANPINDVEGLDLNTDNSSDQTGQTNEVALESTSSSSHTEFISPDGKSSIEDYQANEKAEIASNFTDAVSQSDSKLPLNTSLENLDSSQPSKDVSISNAEVLNNALKSKEPVEEVLKMEEENQEETTQDSVIEDDTDGESMQCSSGTHSNRMSVDEENPGMEVDSEELVATVSTCSTIEMTMEVS